MSTAQDYTVYLKNGSELRPQRGRTLRWTGLPSPRPPCTTFDTVTAALAATHLTGVYVIKTDEAGTERTDVFLPISSIEAIERIPVNPADPLRERAPGR